MQVQVYYTVDLHRAGELRLRMFYSIHQGRGMLEYMFEDSPYEKGWQQLRESRECQLIAI